MRFLLLYRNEQLPSTLKDFQPTARDLHTHVPCVTLVEALRVPSMYLVSHGFCQQACDKPKINIRIHHLTSYCEI